MATSATTAAQSPLDRKILEHFPGLVVRKDLTTELKQNAVVPTYVLEYLLGQHCATDDPVLIQEGLESVRRILSKHYVHRNQAELVKSTIKERGTHKVIDKLTVELNEKGGFYEVEFTNLGLKKVPIVNAAGQVVAAEVFELKYTYDERTEDGFYVAQGLDLIRSRLEEPELL